jgi:hypothetical protein
MGWIPGPEKRAVITCCNILELPKQRIVAVANTQKA